LPGALDDVRPKSSCPKGRSKIGVAKYLGPVPEAKIAGDNHRTPLMAFGSNLKQELGFLLGEGDIAQLIDDEQPIAGIGLLDSL